MNAHIDDTPAGAMTVREGIGGTEVTAIGDLAGTASAAAVAKEIEIRAILAERHPRKVEIFRGNLLAYCKDPGFATAALYCRPVGKKLNDVTGKWEDALAINFSIRFIEAAIPLYKNIYTATRVVFEDQKRLLMNVQVYDVETNTGYSQDSMLSKQVERKDDRDRKVISERTNSYGKRVFIVEATKDEMRNVFGTERSKLIRDYGQKLMPFHVLAEARALIDATNADDVKKDPNAAKKAILDSFAGVGVTAEMLLDYLGRSMDALTPRDVAELRVLFNGIRDNDFSWADVARMKSEPAESAGGDQPAAGSPKTAKLKDRILSARQQAAPPPPQEPEKPQP